MRNAKYRQLKMARKHKVILKQNQPRKARRPLCSKAQFLRALKGSAGIRKTLCEKLRIAPHTLQRYLQRPDWQDMQEALDYEIESGADEAHQTIMHAIRQRIDLGIASTNARWLLSKLRKQQYGDENRTVIEGGDKPIKIAQINIPIEALDLPVETKRQLLEAMDAKEQRDRQAALQAEAPKELTHDGITGRIVQKRPTGGMAAEEA